LCQEKNAVIKLWLRPYALFFTAYGTIEESYGQNKGAEKEIEVGIAH
jgi:hypothetical protein